MNQKNGKSSLNPRTGQIIDCKGRGKALQIGRLDPLSPWVFC